MFCANCGREISGGNFCSGCGAPVGENVCIGQIISPPLTDMERLKNAFSSKLFKTVSILTSVYLGLAVLAYAFVGIYFSIVLTAAEAAEAIPIVISIIAVAAVIGLVLPAINLIGLWKTYKDSKKEGNIDPVGPKLIAGTNCVSYVLLWILAVLEVIGAVLTFILGAAVRQGLFAEYIDSESVAMIFITIIGVVWLISAAVIIVMNILYERRVVKLSRDLAKAAETGVLELGNIKNLHTWMLVMGIISAAGILFGNITSLIPGAVVICESFWVKKYFTDIEQKTPIALEAEN